MSGFGPYFHVDPKLWHTHHHEPPLIDHPVSEFPDTHIIEAEVTDSLKEVLTRLLTCHISAIPIYCTKEKKYIGYVSMKDIFSFIIKVIELKEEEERELVSEAKEGQEAGAIPSLEEVKTLDHLLSIIDANTPGAVLNTVDICVKNEFVSIGLDAKVGEAMKLLKKGHPRVAVLNKEGKIQKMISQSDIMKEIALHLMKMRHFIPGCKEKLTASIQSLNLVGDKELITVQRHEVAFQALRQLSFHNLNALPIVDEDDNLLNNISDHDIRLLAKGMLEEGSLGAIKFSDIYTMDVERFISYLRLSKACRLRGTKHMTSAKLFPTAVTLFPEDSLQSVVETLASTRLHRLYVTDGKKPIGVVSCQDIINLLF